MRFIESILFQNGSYINLSHHQARMDQVFERYASKKETYNLKQILPDLRMAGIFKVRLVYDLEAEGSMYDLDYAQYHPRHIQSLEVVHSDPFDYSLKFEDRTEINTLVNSSTSDDIIIAIDNHITDGSYFNLAFSDGKQWVTPNKPLLRGVRRTQLLQEGKIKEAKITIQDLSSYKKVSLINAMLDLGELELLTSAILLPKNDD